MAYTLKFNRTLKIVELVFSGRLTAQESREATSKAIALGKEYGDADALVDAMEVELDVSIIDLLDLPERLYVEEEMNRRIRVAVVSPRLPKKQGDVRFYETSLLSKINRNPWLLF
ncbi:hypothetical protein DSCW_61830 [Desulfosarcina widdelii]|uniref:Uncharacterized protein n=1 Tax=Desulfosarcina widdelii TaxID=947919 RepID=A0A5K7ZA90_9BACT|nr:hypothetical protein [Desulfosarcina widdelii]BBO78766.1 hypothetical protein DSCW_61830 [Desulfosarcina widdelii]